MTDKISTRTSELERRLEYARRIRKVFGYEGTADHEDVQSILRKFQEEITKEFTDNIVEKLEDNRRIVHSDEDLEWNRAMSDAIEIVKGGAEQ